MTNYNDQQHNKWSNEKAALKKIQIHFEFQRNIMRAIRHEAADKDVSPSDIVRQKLQLSYSKIQRPRIGLSFTDAELESLKQRYQLESIDEKEIKRCAMEEVNAHYSKCLDSE